MIDLLLAVLCSVSIGVIFKHTGPKRIDRTALLTVNYAAAVGIAAVLIVLGERPAGGGLSLSPSLLLLSGGVGALLIAGFFLLAYATDVAGMSLAIGVMRVSVVLPFLASWLVWGEVPSIPQGIGMGMAAVAFFLIAQTPRSSPAGASPSSSAGGLPVAQDLFGEVDGHAFVVLALTFCAGGGVDLSMKAFEEGFGADNSRVLFLLLAFGVAFLIGLLIVVTRGLLQGRWPTWRTVGWGTLLGVVNYGSLEFILRAIAELPGPFVFPANNIAIMVLATGIGVTVWNEQLTRTNRAGIGLAIVALILLRL